MVNTDWLQQELNSQPKSQDYEELPSLKLTPNVITELVVDFSVPFTSWSGTDAKNNPITKKIIPVTVNGVRMNFWLNVKNPLYKDILSLGVAGVSTIKVLQTGTQANTKYVLVK
jgi:hypothetical protein